MSPIIPPGVFLLIAALSVFGLVLHTAPALAASGGPSPSRRGANYCLYAIIGVVVLSLVTKTIAGVLGA